MRIAHFDTSMNWGGQELRVIEQIEWLNTHGHQAWVIARPRSEIIKEAQQRNLPHFELPVRGSTNPKTIFQLHAFLKRENIDILDVHGNRDATYGFFIKLLTRIKIVRSRHVTDSIKSSFLHRLIWTYGNHQIITTANKIKEMIVALGFARHERIYTAEAGDNPQRFNYQLSNAQLKRALGIPSSHKVVANIGMIRPDKGQRYFAEACDQIASRHQDVSFIQVGEATAGTQNYKRELLEYIKKISNRDRIHLLGYRHDIENYLAIADIVVIASIGTEARTRLVAQALLMKKNIVATTVGGLPEILTHNETGLLIAPRSVQAISDSIDRLLKNESFARTLRENGYQHAISTMTTEKMMMGMVSTYQKLCADEKLDQALHQQESVQLTPHT